MNSCHVPQLNDFAKTQVKRTRTAAASPLGCCCNCCCMDDCCNVLHRVPSLQTATHEVSAGHFGQHLRQVKERHGDIGQVLGHGAVHDAEELHRA